MSIPIPYQNLGSLNIDILPRGDLYDNFYKALIGPAHVPAIDEAIIISPESMWQPFFVQYNRSISFGLKLGLSHQDDQVVTAVLTCFLESYDYATDEDRFNMRRAFQASMQLTHDKLFQIMTIFREHGNSLSEILQTKKICYVILENSHRQDTKNILESLIDTGCLNPNEKIASSIGRLEYPLVWAAVFSVRNDIQTMLMQKGAWIDGMSTNFGTYYRAVQSSLGLTVTPKSNFLKSSTDLVCDFYSTVVRSPRNEPAHIISSLIADVQQWMKCLKENSFHDMRLKAYPNLPLPHQMVILGNPLYFWEVLKEFACSPWHAKVLDAALRVQTAGQPIFRFLLDVQTLVLLKNATVKDVPLPKTNIPVLITLLAKRVSMYENLNDFEMHTAPPVERIYLLDQITKTLIILKAEASLDLSNILDRLTDYMLTTIASTDMSVLSPADRMYCSSVNATGHLLVAKRLMIVPGHQHHDEIAAHLVHCNANMAGSEDLQTPKATFLMDQYLKHATPETKEEIAPLFDSAARQPKALLALLKHVRDQSQPKPSTANGTEQADGPRTKKARLI